MEKRATPRRRCLQTRGFASAVFTLPWNDEQFFFIFFFLKWWSNRGSSGVDVQRVWCSVKSEAPGSHSMCSGAMWRLNSIKYHLYIYVEREFWCCFFFFFLALNLKSQSCNTWLHPNEHETHWFSLQLFPSFSLKLEEFRSSDLLSRPSKHFVILNMLFLNCKLFAFPSHISRSTRSGGGGSSVGSLVHRADDWPQVSL